MKGTCVENTVPKLFESKMESFIKFPNSDCKSTRADTFYDIQLNINGKKNIYESFDDYLSIETLKGKSGLEEVEKGVSFLSFSPVLPLNLRRFQYDQVTKCSVKCNDRFEFYEKINLGKYLPNKEATNADYRLHAVLAHSGDNRGSQWVVFINPVGDGKVCEFLWIETSICKYNGAYVVRNNL
ncbi:ubiquitin carboxyl-terminal hydrolase 7-like [Ceratina calcarata]|uniref:Ubiquitin carboxyl-terminal hydrolase 7-like n=1 Tax=Ceratina calcarata TaxID=156304 RepID=A0AAJ7RX98_9HYME|nr:ubiquitin carboxyl-terminal hydrolase 7-like [Ceratina calcarata]